MAVTGEGGAEELEAREVIVATGSTPRTIPGVTIDHKRIITSDEAISLRQVPSSLVILGSGAVGVEFASIYRRFGSEVTIVELLPRLVPNEDEAISAELEKSFKKQGIAVHTGTKVTGATAEREGRHDHGGAPDGETQAITSELLLVATGRAPVTDGLGAEDLGLTMDRGYIKVDELYRTSVPHVSAIGDVVTVGGKGAHPQLAHVSSAEGHSGGRAAGREGREAAELRSRSRLHLLRPRDRQRRADRGRGQGARVRRADRDVPVRRAGPRQDGRRVRGFRQDRRRAQVRRGAGRAHDRPASRPSSWPRPCWPSGSSARSRS